MNVIVKWNWMYSSTQTYALPPQKNKLTLPLKPNPNATKVHQKRKRVFIKVELKHRLKMRLVFIRWRIRTFWVLRVQSIGRQLLFWTLKVILLLLNSLFRELLLTTKLMINLCVICLLFRTSVTIILK